MKRELNYGEEIRGALARGYCHKENDNKVLDPTLIEAMAQEVEKIGVEEEKGLEELFTDELHGTMKDRKGEEVIFWTSKISPKKQFEIAKDYFKVHPEEIGCVRVQEVLRVFDEVWITYAQIPHTKFENFQELLQVIRKALAGMEAE